MTTLGNAKLHSFTGGLLWKIWCHEFATAVVSGQLPDLLVSRGCLCWTPTSVRNLNCWWRNLYHYDHWGHLPMDQLPEDGINGGTAWPLLNHCLCGDKAYLQVAAWVLHEDLAKSVRNWLYGCQMVLLAWMLVSFHLDSSKADNAWLLLNIRYPGYWSKTIQAGPEKVNGSGARKRNLHCCA